MIYFTFSLNTFKDQNSPSAKENHFFQRTSEVVPVVRLFLLFGLLYVFFTHSYKEQQSFYTSHFHNPCAYMVISFCPAVMSSAAQWQS